MIKVGQFCDLIVKTCETAEMTRPLVGFTILRDTSTGAQPVPRPVAVKAASNSSIVGKVVV